MKVFRLRLLFRFGILPGILFRLVFDYSNGRLPTYPDFLVLAFLLYLALFALTAKVIADGFGLHFLYPMLPLLNESVGWNDVKRADDFGSWAKEIEYHSRRRRTAVLKRVGTFDYGLVPYVQQKMIINISEAE